MAHVPLTTVLLGALALSFSGLAGASAPDTPKTRADHSTTESAQPGTDTWITTKVKADLLTTKDVPGLDLKVETVNGVVTLTGRVDSQAEADRAIHIARNIDGVSRVDSSGITVANDTTR